METPQGPSAEMRSAWLQDRIESWPSEADREAFQRALAEQTSVHAWTPPEQFTASVLRAYESYAPRGHTAADLLGYRGGADATALAHWLHHQDSQWGGTAPLPRLQSAAIAAGSTARAAWSTAIASPRSTLSTDRHVRAVAHAAIDAAGRWLIRQLVQATPRAP